jgi:uncharacterized protein (DUF2141 family)
MKLFKILIILFIFTTVKPLISFGQYTLTIEINDLQNNNGQLILAFYNEKEIKIKGVIQPIVGKKCIILIENLKPGKYSFKYFHDENKNEKLDVNWIGIPKEGFGFSNNAKARFGPPSFEKTIFEIKENATLKCSPSYY